MHIYRESVDTHTMYTHTHACVCVYIYVYFIHMKYSLVAETVKRLPAMPKTWVRSLGQEDPLEKEMATHSSTLAWKIP